MKYLKKLFESQLPTHIEDNLLGITDVLGEPKVSERKNGNLRNYTLEWKFKMFSSINGVPAALDIESFFNQTKALLKFEHDLLSAKNRLKNFDIKINLNQHAEKLKVYLTEKGEKTKTGGFIKHLDVENLKIILNKDWLQEYFNYFEGMNDFPAVFSIEIDEYSIDQGYAVPYDGILIEAEDAWPEDLYVEEDNVYVSDDLKDAIQKELNYFDEKGTTQVYVDSDYDELEMSFFYQEKGEWTRPSARTGYRIEWA